MREYLPSLDWKMARTIAFARRNFHGMKHVGRIAINSLSKSERIYTLFFYLFCIFFITTSYLQITIKTLHIHVYLLLRYLIISISIYTQVQIKVPFQTSGKNRRPV